MKLRELEIVAIYDYPNQGDITEMKFHNAAKVASFLSARGLHAVYEPDYSMYPAFLREQAF